MSSTVFTAELLEASSSLDELLAGMAPLDPELASTDPKPADREVVSVATCKTDPIKPKKKRVRREVRELKYLRDQARKLELRLEQLQKRVSTGKQRYVAASNNHKNYTVEHAKHPTVLSVWSSIAERQLRERVRSEQLHRTLRAACSDQARFIAELKKNLNAWTRHKQLDTSLIVRQPTAFRDLWAQDAAEIFAEQLMLVKRMNADLQQHSYSCSLPQASSELTKGEEVVKRNPSVRAGVVFEMHTATTLPFDVHVAGNAYWRMSVYEAYNRQGSHVENLDTASDLVAASFSLNVACKDFTANIHGHQTCKRYINEDSECIVWVGYANPVEFNGARFCGVQCRQSGWIKLRRCPGQATGSTSVETYSEMYPVFKDGTVDEAGQIRALIDSMGRAHGKTNDIYCQMIRELLVEEDWKASCVTGMATLT